MSKRETKTKVREIWQRTFADVPEGDDALRAARVRALCPCQNEWSVPLWDIIFAACNDPSHLVRMEALHVIEDAFRDGKLKDCRGKDLLFKAINDPHPEVRNFIKDTLKQQPKLAGQRRQAFQERANRHDALRNTNLARSCEYSKGRLFRR